MEDPVLPEKIIRESTSTLHWGRLTKVLLLPALILAVGISSYYAASVDLLQLHTVHQINSSSPGSSSAANSPLPQSRSHSLTNSPLSSTPTSTIIPATNWKLYVGNDFTFRSPEDLTVRRISAQETDIIGKWFQGIILSQRTPFPRPEQGKIDDSLFPSTTLVRVEKKFVNLAHARAEEYLVACDAPDCYIMVVYAQNNDIYYEMKFDLAGGGLQDRAQEILGTLEFTK